MHARQQHFDEQPEGAQRLLGLPLHLAAPAMAALSDFEEMVLSLIHPLVQVYTIPTTGELAYVGHVCNFRQKVSKFLSSIPVQKAKFPGMVVVRPRQLHGQGAKRMPYPVNVQKLRRAFEWLKVHNAYYKNVDWDDAAADSWDNEDAELPTQQYDETSTVALTRSEFEEWMKAAEVAESLQGAGFPMGRNLQKYLVSRGTASDASAHAVWKSLLEIIAEDSRKDCWRYADGVKQEHIAIVLQHYVGLDMGIESQDFDAAAQLSLVPFEEWSQAYRDLAAELQAIKVVMQQGEQREEIGALPELVPEDDVGARDVAFTKLRDAVNLDASAATNHGDDSCPTNAFIVDAGEEPEDDNLVVDDDHSCPSAARIPHSSLQQLTFVFDEAKDIAGNASTDTWLPTVDIDEPLAIGSAKHLSGATNCQGQPPAIGSSDANSIAMESFGVGNEEPPPVDNGRGTPFLVPNVVSERAARKNAPRIDAPEVEDSLGQAVPENEPGYIPCAFPKLFPFGAGDYHADRRGLCGKPDFAKWGRYVLLWHDGRFMRHTRFRYWLLDLNIFLIEMTSPFAASSIQVLHQSPHVVCMCFGSFAIEKESNLCIDL